MKKIVSFVLIFVVMCCLFGCKSNSVVSPADSAGLVSSEQDETNELPSEKTDAAELVDVDLTKLSGTMVYSEVYNMLVSPEDYYGKIVKMKGNFAIYQDETTGKIYYAVIIADATACCSQGLEFVLAGDYSYPDDYPELGEELTVTGEFQTYDEDGVTYCNLINAEMN